MNHFEEALVAEAQAYAEMLSKGQKVADIMGLKVKYEPESEAVFLTDSEGRRMARRESWGMPDLMEMRRLRAEMTLAMFRPLDTSY